MHSTVTPREANFFNKAEPLRAPPINCPRELAGRTYQHRSAQRPPDCAEQTDGHDDVAVAVADAEGDVVDDVVERESERKRFRASVCLYAHNNAKAELEVFHCQGIQIRPRGTRHPFSK